MQPEQPIYTDPVSGQRYSVDPSTGRSYWLPDPGPNPGTSAFAPVSGPVADAYGPVADGYGPDADAYGVGAYGADAWGRDGHGQVAHGRTRRVGAGRILLGVGLGGAALLVAVGVVGSLISPGPDRTTQASSSASTHPSPTVSDAAATTDPPAAGTPGAVAAAAATSPTGRTPTTPTTTSTTSPTTSPTAKATPSRTAAPTKAAAPTTSARRPPTSPAAAAFANCTALNRVYPHGVGRPGAVDRTTGKKPVTNFTVDANVYAANTGRDRDDDGIACEKA